MRSCLFFSDGGLRLIRALEPLVEETVLGVHRAAEQGRGGKGECALCHVNEIYYCLQDNNTVYTPSAAGRVASGDQSRYD
jgi:hypothetical protein